MLMKNAKKGTRIRRKKVLTVWRMLHGKDKVVGSLKCHLIGAQNVRMMAELIAVMVLLDELLVRGQFGVDGLEHDLGVRGPMMNEQNTCKASFGNVLLHIVLLRNFHLWHHDIGNSMQYTALIRTGALNAVPMRRKVWCIRFALREFHVPEFMFAFCINSREREKDKEQTKKKKWLNEYLLSY